MKQKITTHLVYKENAEKAVQFYLSVFKTGRIISTSYFSEGDPGPAGTICAIHFELFGQPFFAVNGGESFSFTEAMSLYVSCDTQAEIDELWEKLSAGGKTSVCGWLTDQFGVSWQIAPTLIEEVMTEGNPEKIDRVNKVVFRSTKLNIAEIQAALEGV